MDIAKIKERNAVLTAKLDEAKATAAKKTAEWNEWRAEADTWRERSREAIRQGKEPLEEPSQIVGEIIRERANEAQYEVEQAKAEADSHKYELPIAEQKVLHPQIEVAFRGLILPLIEKDQLIVFTAQNLSVVKPMVPHWLLDPLKKWLEGLG